MSISVEIDEVVAPDAVPGEVPHKISDEPSKEELVYKFTPTAAGPIRAWMVRAGVVLPTRSTGVVVARQGVVCGTGGLCGAAGSIPLSMASGTQVAEVFGFSDVAPGTPDGVYPFKVFALSEEDGWSS